MQNFQENLFICCEFAAAADVVVLDFGSALCYKKIVRYIRQLETVVVSNRSTKAQTDTF